MPEVSLPFAQILAKNNRNPRRQRPVLARCPRPFLPNKSGGRLSIPSLGGAAVNGTLRRQRHLTRLIVPNGKVFAAE